MGYASQLRINGVSIPIASNLYGTCNTIASTAEKIVTMPELDNVKTGVTIHVKFLNTNTATEPLLNVNGTGAKAIYCYSGTAPSVGYSGSWLPGSIISFTYDGAGWVMNDFSKTDDIYDALTEVLTQTDVVNYVFVDSV